MGVNDVATGIARLNARIPETELNAFRSWCVEHDLTMSRALTGLLHTFNVRQAKATDFEVEATRQRIETAAHAKAQQFKEQGNALRKQAAPLNVDFLDA